MEQPGSVVFSEEGLAIVQARLETLRVDLGASVALLLDAAGQLLTDCGWHGDFDINVFLALLGNEMSAANVVAHLLRDEAAFDLHYHEGEKYEMYTVRISDRIFLTMIFERRAGASGRVGLVWLTLRRAITELRTLLNRAMVKPGSVERQEIQGAISDALDEALNRIEDDLLLSKPAPDSSCQVSDKTPTRPANAPAPSSPPPADSGDSNRVLSYKEARARGLINMDDQKEK